MVFIFERSRVPIYQRIEQALISALRLQGHEVHYFDAAEFKDLKNLVQLLSGLKFDFYVATNEFNRLHEYNPASDTFVFEELPGRKIFIWHDNALSGLNDELLIEKKMRRLSGRRDVFHFCLERSNVSDLKSIGVENAFHLNHASELLPVEVEQKTDHVNFVGHVMTDLSLYPVESLVLGHRLRELAYLKLDNAGCSIQDKIDAMVDLLDLAGDKFKKLARRQFLFNQLNSLSSAFRGNLLQSISTANVTVYGGDLSYGAYQHPLMKIESPRIAYQPALDDYSIVGSVYAGSRISLNITSLQFDHAVNNRVLDVICSGGFVITDFREDLVDISPALLHLSYKNAAELNSLLNYYLDPANEKKYLELKRQIHSDVRNRFGYEQVAKYMMRCIF